ncbi:polyprenyl synthetase family protein, partial [Streptomyces sp. UH6]|uniref:polyprenyl synthetase family protein n=1 Tax=Streptomyces sp. UH6 TaxID=2748379 RepID=UPI0015D4F92D
GRQAGLAFQLIDDLIGLWGDPRRTAKPAGADLAARKKSLPVVAALAEGGPASRRLRSFYAAPDAEGGPATEVLRRLVEEAGGREAAEREAARQLSRALRALSCARPTAEAYRLLQEVADAVTRRDC